MGLQAAEGQRSADVPGAARRNTIYKGKKNQEANVLLVHFKQAWAKHRQAYNRDQSCITRKEEGLPKPCISLPPLHLLWSTYKAPCMLHHLNELAKQTPGLQRFDLAGLASSKPKLSAPLPWVQSPSSWLCIRPQISTSKGHLFLCISAPSPSVGRYCHGRPPAPRCFEHHFAAACVLLAVYIPLPGSPGPAPSTAASTADHTNDSSALGQCLAGMEVDSKSGEPLDP